MSKRNENRRGYKKTRVGWIPEEWESVLLEDIAQRATGHTPDKKKPAYWNGGVKWVSLADSDKLDRPVIENTSKEVSELGIENSSAKYLPKGTVILLRDAGVGRSTILGNRMAVSQHFVAWICGEKNLNLYLYYYLQSRKREFERVAVGSTIVTIGMRYFVHLRIPLPPIPEQKKIAEILSTWDRAIEITNRLITNYELLKKGLMQQLLTGRMRFPEFNHETHEKKKGELPEGWLEVMLGELCKITYGKEWKDVACSESAYPVYGTGGVIGYASSPLYSGPSILLGRKGTIDNPVYINGPFWAVDTTFYTEIKKEMDSKFTFFLFCCIHWRRYNEASGVPSLSRSTIERIKLAIPSQPEQTCIAAVLSTCDREIELLKKKQEKLKEQKKGLMQKLLTGEVRVKI